jgi:protein-tyrosine phosphatase
MPVDLLNPFTELPYILPGRVFRSRMPFDARDPSGDLLNRFIAESIGVVVVLADDREILMCTGRDLRLAYQAHGMSVIYLPIADYAAPVLDALDRAVLSAMLYIESGKNLVVHCHAGVGRTGLFLACLAQRTLQLSPEESIDWVRRYIHGALETPEQIRLAMEYGELIC